MDTDDTSRPTCLQTAARLAARFRTQMTPEFDRVASQLPPRPSVDFMTSEPSGMVWFSFRSVMLQTLSALWSSASRRVPSALKATSLSDSEAGSHSGSFFDATVLA